MGTPLPPQHTPARSSFYAVHCAHARCCHHLPCFIGTWPASHKRCANDAKPDFNGQTNLPSRNQAPQRPQPQDHACRINQRVALANVLSRRSIESTLIQRIALGCLTLGHIINKHMQASLLSSVHRRSAACCLLCSTPHPTQR